MYSYTRPDRRQPSICRREYRRYGFIRYADDFLVTAESKEDIEAILPTLEAWLAERGLELNKDKTSVAHVGEGVDFLGFRIRQFKGRCYTFPQKEKVLSFLAGIRAWLRANLTARPQAVILALNPQLRGWGNYYRHAASKTVFQIRRSPSVSNALAMGVQETPQQRKTLDRQKVLHACSPPAMDFQLDD